MERGRLTGVISGRHRCEWQKMAIQYRAEATRLRRKFQALGIDPHIRSVDVRVPGRFEPPPATPWRDLADDLATALRTILDDPSSRAGARAALARHDAFLAGADPLPAADALPSKEPRSR